ncbi:MAG: CinA family nicotinamide mononucleotide deamidase-related protein [Chloroflexi bacterium]|nr:CinA family nicotinamide mononucleotide deamidase-related protein [Chloroflexota bacterium]MQC25998.1 CinA family nicotinamide mononucleotide deamidase-related protein [Chloroflexota bacterium]
MPSAEILTIGTELLLGDILDSNAQYLARQLRDIGIDHFWTTTVGDNKSRIAEAVRLALSRSEIVITTGGLGPTVDDVTREGLAAALGVELDFQEDLWVGIQERFERFGRSASENNKRQAYVPAGGEPLDNPVGSAPGLMHEANGKLIFAMPGVPREMQAITQESVLPLLKARYGDDVVIRSRVLHIAGVPESLIDERIADLERQTNPTVGLAAHAGSVDVRLTAKASTSAETDALLDALEGETRARLEDWVFGVDGDTLPGVITAELTRRNWRLAGAEFGLGGLLGQSFAEPDRVQVEDLSEAPADALAMAVALAESEDQNVALVASLVVGKSQSDLVFGIVLPNKAQDYRFSYGGVGEEAPMWAVNASLSVLRKLLAKS